MIGPPSFQGKKNTPRGSVAGHIGGGVAGRIGGSVAVRIGGSVAVRIATVKHLQPLNG